VWCVMLNCSFCSFMQAALEPAGGEKWLCFFFSVMQPREAFCGLRVQNVTEFDSD
jgi:hypothetical protein